MIATNAVDDTTMAAGAEPCPHSPELLEQLEQALKSPARAFRWYDYLILTGLAALVSAGWATLEADPSRDRAVATAAMWSIGVSVATCGATAVALVWLVSLREQRISRSYRAILQEMTTQDANDAARQPLAIAAEHASKPPLRVDAPHAAVGIEPNHTAWLPWSTFSRVVTAQKFYARERGRPFTLLHLRAVKSDPINAARSVRLEPAHDATRKLQELLNVTMRPDDLASISPAGDCFMLMPETVHEVGRAFAGRLAKQVQPVLGDDRLVEIRQFTYVGSRKSEAMRVAGHPLAA